MHSQKDVQKYTLPFPFRICGQGFVPARRNCCQPRTKKCERFREGQAHGAPSMLILWTAPGARKNPHWFETALEGTISVICTSRSIALAFTFFRPVVLVIHLTGVYTIQMT